MAAMMRRAAQAVLLGMMLTFGGAPAVLAGGHMTTYHLSPDHDDLGRSNEPDGAVSSVLGAALATCNVDVNLDGQCEVYPVVTPNPFTNSRVLAPGCTGDGGRAASGLCWLSIQTGGIVGEPGMSLNRAPGAFTTDQGQAVRLFDLIVYAFPLRGYIDYNNKLEDLGVTDVLAGLNPDFGGDFVNPGLAGWSAWYGTWTDENGNGVIDYLSASPENPGNEFQWIGQCGATPAWECNVQATSIPLWFYPGNHHAFATPDLPGLQVACFVTAVAQQGVCAPTIAGIDPADEDFQGDPFLGPQNGVRPDSALDDRTDDPVNARHYTVGNGFPLWHYDQSLLVSEVVIAAVNPAAGDLGGFDPEVAAFRDVDVFTTWSPVAEDLLQNQLKPMVRSEWVSVRDGFIPLSTWVDGQVNNAAFDTTPTTGPVDDAVSDPGRSREPNSFLDAYPGASHGECASSDETHQGFCNDYGPHAAGPHAFADLQLFRSAFLVKPSVAGIGLPLIYGPAAIDGGATAVPPRAPGDHGRHLEPGIYDPLGNIGIWRDLVHTMHEEVNDPINGLSTFDYVVGQDGWVANIVNNTGLFRYRGYQPQSCTIFGLTAVYEHAQCDPYSNGANDDPQTYGAPDGEFAGRCNVVPTLTVRPDGVWTDPVFVWRDLETFEVTNPRIEDHTGTSDVLNLKLECIGGTASTSGNFVGRDMLILPLGNPNTGVTTILDTTLLTVGPDLPPERVIDVDYYRPR